MFELFLTSLKAIGAAGLGFLHPIMPCESSQSGGESSSIALAQLGERLDADLVGLEVFGLHAAVLVEKDGEVILSKGYGLADDAAGKRLTSDTAFDIGSLRDIFLAAAALRLESMGRLRIEDSIGMHLADAPQSIRAITIHQLLTRTSGLTSAGLDDVPPVSEPGGGAAIAGVNRRVLSEIIASAAGESCERFITTHLLAPTGLTQTCFVTSDPADHAGAQREKLASSYLDDKPQAPPESCMASTLADLGRWLASLRDRTVLNEAECARLMSEQVRGEGETAGMGYGWLHSTSPRGARLVSRDAVHGGFSALIRLYPDDAASIIVLSNRVVNGRAPCEAVANRIDALMHGGEVAEIPAVIEIDEELLKPVAGLYVLMPSWLVMVETDGQSLVLAGDSQDPMNAIFSPTVADDERAFASRTCKDAQWIMQQASRANFKPLIEHVSPSIEWAAAKTSLEQWFADPRRASGDFKFARAQGTIVAGNGCGRTVLRVVFNQGQDLSFLYEFIWRDRKIVAMSGTEKMPRRRFLHTGDGHFSSFDVLSGRTTGFQIVHPPPDGASTRIRLVFDSGAIVYRSRDQ